MSNTIITEAQGTKHQAPTPFLERNRRMLIKALSEGVAVQMSIPAGYLVNSRTHFGELHLVESRTRGDGKRVERCACEWGKRQGEIVSGSGKLPCGHILVVRWHLLDELCREAVLDQDPELAAVAGRAEKAVA